MKAALLSAQINAASTSRTSDVHELRYDTPGLGLLYFRAWFIKLW